MWQTTTRQHQPGASRGLVAPLSESRTQRSPGRAPAPARLPASHRTAKAHCCCPKCVRTDVLLFGPADRFAAPSLPAALVHHALLYHLCELSSPATRWRMPSAAGHQPSSAPRCALKARDALTALLGLPAPLATLRRPAQPHPGRYTLRATQRQRATILRQQPYAAPPAGPRHFARPLRQRSRALRHRKPSLGGSGKGLGRGCPRVAAARRWHRGHWRPGSHGRRHW